MKPSPESIVNVASTCFPLSQASHIALVRKVSCGEGSHPERQILLRIMQPNTHIIPMRCISRVIVIREERDLSRFYINFWVGLADRRKCHLREKCLGKLKYRRRKLTSHDESKNKETNLRGK